MHPATKEEGDSPFGPMVAGSALCETSLMITMITATLLGWLSNIEMGKRASRSETSCSGRTGCCVLLTNI